MEARTVAKLSTEQEMLLFKTVTGLQLSQPSLEVAKSFGKQKDPLRVCVLLVVKSEGSCGRAGIQWGLQTFSH